MSAGKAFIALPIVIAFGVSATACIAEGSDRYTGPRGYQVQTWCQVDPACNGWDQKIQRLSEGRRAADSFTSPIERRRLTHHHTAKER
jgi:hypothetical protein